MTPWAAASMDRHDMLPMAYLTTGSRAMEGDSWLIDGLSMLARSREGFSVDLAVPVAQRIAELWRSHQPLPPADDYTMALVKEACKDQAFLQRAYDMWNAVCQLAHDGKPPVQLDSEGALQLLALLRNIRMVSSAWNYNKE